MQTNSILLTLLCTLLLAAGQILFKLAAQQLKLDTGKLSDLVHSVIFNPYLIIGLAIYGVATLLWIWVLKDAPLNLAYPIMALAFIIVPLLSVVIFNEPFHAKYLYGGLLIVLGVVLISR